MFEILEIPKVRDNIFGNFGIDFGRADCHPSDDRPCTTSHLKGHGLSTGGGATIHIYIYICISTTKPERQPSLPSVYLLVLESRLLL